MALRDFQIIRFDGNVDDVLCFPAYHRYLLPVIYRQIDNPLNPIQIGGKSTDNDTPFRVG